MKRIVLLLILSISFIVAGCEDMLNAKYTTPEQKNHGMIFILPGIQGVDFHYTNIRDGLIGSGINCAIMIHPWGCQIPGINLLVNETDTQADREWGRKIAEDIVKYQMEYPARPVILLGQSGGAAVSVFAAESLSKMPQAKPIDCLILLDGSISSNYDLTRALSVCKRGIVNFYNPDDVALLKYGTQLMGNLDGGHGNSAGRTGFDRSYSSLYQVRINKNMVDDFADPHFADCSKAFTAHYISPWIIDRQWPPTYVYGAGKVESSRYSDFSDATRR